MVWVRLDDHFDQNPKIASVGAAALGLWVCGLAYCNRNLTDGFIPWSVARTLVSFEWLSPDPLEDDTGDWPIERLAVTTDTGAERVSAWPFGAHDAIKLLVSAGLWDETANGYVVHDYADFQPTKAQVEADRVSKQSAGRAGGQARAQASAKARAQAEPKQVLEQTPSNRSSKTQAESKPVPDPDPSATDVAEHARLHVSVRERAETILSALPGDRREQCRAEAELLATDVTDSGQIALAMSNIRRMPRGSNIPWPSVLRDELAELGVAGARAEQKPKPSKDLPTEAEVIARERAYLLEREAAR